MLINAKTSCFMLIDVQEKLTEHVVEHEKLLTHITWLLSLANELGEPVIVTEQYPKGLLSTVAELKPYIEHAPIFDKVYFSSARDEKVHQYLKSQSYQQIILFGIEAHVCILQTALDLKQLGYQVFVVADAISARDPMAITLAIERMSQAGVIIVNTEMVFFELLEKAGTEQFKKLSKQFL